MMFTVSDVSGFVLESIWFPYFGIGSCRHSYPFDTEERAVIEHNARAFPFLGASQEGVKRAAAKRPPCGVVPSQGSSCPEPREGGHRPSSLELRRSLVVS